MIILGISVIVCASIFSISLVSIRTKEVGYITVTGSATTSFTSNLIVWRGSFSKKAGTPKEAYEKLKTDIDTVRNYLLNRGVKEEEIVFSAVDMNENYEQEYSQGNFVRRIFTGYTLTQHIAIQSAEVDKIEAISRDITELIDLGVELFSMQPEYYYTKLDEIKIDLISKATENARIRAEKIIEQSGGRINKLMTANLGVFQITAENSSADDYSSGGAFDVRSKNKTAFITTRLVYNLR
jgi:hypothetical protein